MENKNLNQMAAGDASFDGNKTFVNLLENDDNITSNNPINNKNNNDISVKNETIQQLSTNEKATSMKSLNIDGKKELTKTSNANSNKKMIRKNSTYSNLNDLKVNIQFEETFDDESNNRVHLPSKAFYRKKPNTNRSPLSVQSTLFILIGVFLGFFLATLLRKSLLNCSTFMSCCPNTIIYTDNNNNLQQFGKPNDNIKVYTQIEDTKNLVFIGVMTAQKYLDTRAKSVFETWGADIPGKMSFFSRSGSSSAYKIPLVSLPGVDDAYPPQKKSFMMLKFMHDNYLDKFEWFMRVDDDVYIKPDKLELFLRSLNSSKPQFIGQAGLGNKDEFGLLSLDYDENFCMGGPGIVMSRETLRLVVPHISYCLKNLYSTHEDVEIGRCIRKFANVSCTWSYEMQKIFHHNSSGNAAFTGDLLSREVLRAISLHPVKQYKYQYRLHNFFRERKIFDLRQRHLELKRQVFQLKTELLAAASSGKASTTTVTSTTTTDKQNDQDAINTEIESEFDNIIFNKNENYSRTLLANRFNLPATFRTVDEPAKREHRYDFDFFTRSLFSYTYVSPKRGLEGYWKRSIVDTIRQLMDEINRNSIERGRLIDYKDTLYGYVRHDPLLGLDYIMDILLVYRKYEGRKMTVPVRRHAYVRNTFTTLLWREDDLVSSIYLGRADDNNQPSFDASNPTNVSTAGDQINERSGNVLFKYISDLVDGLFNHKLTDLAAESTNTSARSAHHVHPNLELVKTNEPSELAYYANRIVNQKVINFVLPLSGRWEIFKRFVANYEETCVRPGENTRLAVVLFENEQSQLIQDDRSGKMVKQSVLVEQIFHELKKKYPRLSQESLMLIVNNTNFSRSIGCELGAAQFGPHDLIFFVDVDIMFSSDFLLRARLNTIEYKQVYYPIVYSEYDPDDVINAIRVLNEPGTKAQSAKLRPAHFEFTYDSGYWRQFGFGIVLVYNSDLRRVGGFDTSIVGWGKEDVDLYEKFIKSNLTIFRSIDPGLVHVFHKIECDVNLAEEQMIMCMGSKSTSIASQRVLANLIYEKKQHLLDTRPKHNSTVSKLNHKNPV